MDHSLGDEATRLPSDLGESLSELEPGDVVDVYRVVRLLGRGGMGEVYEVEHQKLRTRYALKIIPHRLARQTGFVERFEREARVMATLNHPNIVRVGDSRETDGRYWLRMELVSGVAVRRGDKKEHARSLADLVALGGGKLPQRTVANLLLAILDALAYAHGKGVVHRDLKPGNVLLTVRGRRIFPRISDFGLVRLVGESWVRREAEASLSSQLTGRPEDSREELGSSSRSLVGTYAYMSPEQKQGGEVDARSDLYAVGLVTFRLLTGQKDLSFDLPSQIESTLTPGWDEFLRRALRPKPDERFQTAEEMRRAVTAMLEEIARAGGSGKEGEGEAEIEAEPESAPRRRRLALFAAAAFAAVALIAVGAWALASRSDGEAKPTPKRPDAPARTKPAEPTKGAAPVIPPTKPKRPPKGAPDAAAKAGGVSAAAKPKSRGPLQAKGAAPKAEPRAKAPPEGHSAAKAGPASPTANAKATGPVESEAGAAMAAPSKTKVSEVGGSLGRVRIECWDGAPLINDLAFTKRYVWASTNCGALRIDRATGKQKEFRERDGFPAPSAHSVATTAAGDVWFGLDQFDGVVKYDGAAFRRYACSASGADLRGITTVFVDGKGRVWRVVMGTLLRPLYLDGEKWRSPPRAPRGQFGAMAEDPGGALWFGGVKRVYRFDGKRWQDRTPGRSVVKPPILAGKDPRGVACDGQGNVWLTPYSDRSAVLVLPKGRSRWRAVRLGERKRARKIALDSRGLPWIAYDRRVLRPSDSPLRGLLQILHPTRGPKIELMGVCAARFDDAGSLWLAAREKIIRLDPRSGRRADVAVAGAAWGIPKDVARDAQGTVWVAGHGLFQKAGSSWKAHYTTSASQRFHGLALDREGGVWIGAQTNVQFYQSGRFREYPLPEQFPKLRNPRSVAVDRDGHVWAADCLGGGVARFASGRWQEAPVGSLTSGRYPSNVATRLRGEPWLFGQRYSVAPGQVWRRVGRRFERVFSYPRPVRSVAWDRQGRFLALCSDGSIHRQQGGRFAVWRQTEVPIPITMTVDTADRVWVGCGAGALYVWPGARSKPVVLTGRDGLPGGEVFRLRAFDDGSVWVCQAGGVARITVGGTPGVKRERVAGPSVSGGFVSTPAKPSRAPAKAAPEAPRSDLVAKAAEALRAGSVKSVRIRGIRYKVVSVKGDTVVYETPWKARQEIPIAKLDREELLRLAKAAKSAATRPKAAPKR